MVNFLILILLILVAATVYSEYASNVIDVDDILAEDFMPGTLLVLENPTGGAKNFNASIKNVETMHKLPDGSFHNAMETMNFHRSMMNQYLCRNFVAEQIIKDMTTSRVNRRMGHITPGSDIDTNKPSKFKDAIQNNLLNDEGSSNYKNWLAKSATLEDIYRHYDQAQNKVDADIIEEEDKGEDFDEEYNGHLTGYVYPHPQEGHTPVKHRGHTGLGMYYAGGKFHGGGYPYPNAVYHHGGGSEYHHGGSESGYHHSGGSGGQYHGGDSGYHHSAGGGGVYSHDGGYADVEDTSGGGHSAYGGGHHAVVETIYHGGPPKYHGQHETSYGGKDHDLSDLFDIALTALAFLSFGLFIVHVVMCISAANNNATTTVASMMMPMSMSPTATATGTGNGGGGMTSTGGGGTGGGTTSTGTGNGSTGTGTGGGMPATGGGSTGMGNGSTGTGTGGGMPATGGGSTGMGNGSTGTGTGGGMPATGGGSTGTGGGDMGTGGGDSGGTGGENTGTGGAATGTGGGDIDGGGGSTGTGGGNAGTGGGGDGGTAGGTTDSTSPGTGTGTGDGTTSTGTGTGGGTTSTGNDASTGTGSGRDTFKFRLKRDIPTITNPNNQALNELARRVLTSIEAALVANDDGGVCLRKSLCENNKYSRNLEGKDKIIIPMWSLGMSWLSGRLVKNVAPATSMLDTLKASILGLGRANCEIIYQECDLRRERRKRRRRRRKRDAV